MSAANLDFFDLSTADFNGLVNEDVMQQIFDISEISLPFTGMIGSDKVGNAYAEWTIDKLQTQDLTNATVDGADASGDDTSIGQRVGNFTQLPDKVVRVSDRARAGNTIGFTDTLAYQLLKRGDELRRDVEGIMLENQASNADDGAAVPGRLGGFPSWLTTNTSRGATGADGGFNAGIVDAPTEGNARGNTETLVRDIAQSVWEQGGDPTVLMSVPGAMRGLSEYMFTSSSRIARLQRDEQGSSAATALGSVSVFLTDFDVTLEFVANRLQNLYTSADATPVANMFIISPAFAMQGFLQGYRVDPLDRTGTADNRQMTTDVTLKVLNEAAHGVIADIDPTVAVVT